MAVNIFGIVVLYRRAVRKTKEREETGRSLRNNPTLSFVGLAYLLCCTGLETSQMHSLTTAVVLALVAAGAIGWFGLRHVPAGQVGIVHRRFGRTHAEFRNVTPYTTQGVLARTLLPGRHWLFPFLHDVRLVPRTHVAEGKVGLVTAKEGRARQGNRSLARSVSCDSFQDGEAFLLNGGEQGTQVDVLAGGQSYYINTALFEVEQVDRVRVPAGTIGLVDAKDGKVRPPGSLFGPHVECDDFQDGGRFLDGGGHQGRQLAILQGGSYYNINPALFDVITVDTVGRGGGELTARHLQQISIPVGHVGVVITLDGAEPESHDQPAPRVAGHQGFRLPWVFLQNGGRRGVQEETLGEGTVCALNPYFVRVVPVPTHLLTLEWDEKTPEEESRNYDAHLGQIAVFVQGHRILVDVKQTLRIPPASAPALVSRNGGSQMSGLGGLDENRLPVQRFVQRVLGASVASYFNEIAAESTIRDFLEAREIRTNLASQVLNALDKWGVEARSTHLVGYRAEDPVLNEILQKPAHEQSRGELLKLQLINAEQEDAIDAVRMRAENRRAALELRTRIEVLGLDNVMVLEMLQEITKAPVPQFIGGGDLSKYLETQPLARLEELLDRMQRLNTAAGIDDASRLTLDKGDGSGEDPGVPA
ncbi:SPFH domain-containing protein [Streptomyces sp. CL12]|uniref:SPFH domain-containing protein n=1 Tax=Streptomyces sp. CL12 TaxID=3391744 RepID=UPI003A7FA0A9